nr:bifunctional precorrin-2 dehydrogenase/sirohydrochlorin ferrochelatase [uncultured Pseudodesulfovibrio sp.]
MIIARTGQFLILHVPAHWLSRVMRYYPIFLNLENKACLVVGAGGVGKRKIQSLLDSGAGHVTIVDTCEVDVEMESILGADTATYQCREFVESDLDDKFLVIACTSSEAVNQRISKLCADRNVLCNVADQPEKCSFIVPATIKRGDLTIAISTAGQSPAMAKCIRKDLQESFGDEYAVLLSLMGRIRPLILGLGQETKQNTAVFRSLVNSNLLVAIKNKNLDAAREILKESLPEPLYANIPEILDGLI